MIDTLRDLEAGSKFEGDIRHTESRVCWPHGELRRLDLLIHREVLRLRAAYHLSLDEFRGLYVSDEQVDALVTQTAQSENRGLTLDALSLQADEMRTCIAEAADPNHPWHRLAVRFGLSAIEQDLLLVAIAPELDLKYETLYAYLNNDVTRKWPTVDLAARLTSSRHEPRYLVEQSLTQDSKLFRSGLLRWLTPAADRFSRLAAGFAPAPVLLAFLHGYPPIDPLLTPFVCRDLSDGGPSASLIPPETLPALEAASRLFRGQPPDSPVVVLEGRPGSGRRAAALHLCHILGRPLLLLDLEAVVTAPDQIRWITDALGFQARLEDAAIYLTHCAAALFDPEGRPISEAARLILRLAENAAPVFIECEPGLRWKDALRDRRAIHLVFGEADAQRRAHLWSAATAERGIQIPGPEVRALAERFALTPGQIVMAARDASDAAALSEDSSPDSYSAALFAAARAQSSQGLGRLAAKVRLCHDWDDLVLPAATMARVREVADAIRNQHQVYTEWGFGAHLGTGAGLKALFSGASGTGKTMSASVIAGDLGLELFKVDLSGVVSKYIGETEKNLDRIFSAAHLSNAILFFDEADAIFGKRSEVRDAHDRYANIETAYLLQKMEEHEGAVILATNLSGNIDDAFSRRMNYVIEFPLPDERLRERLWQGMFPPRAPMGADVDFGFLARQFPMSGGDIKNVALAAAFLAARDRQNVGMGQLVRSMARQIMKQGRMPSQSEFKQYFARATAPDRDIEAET